MRLYPSWDQIKTLNNPLTEGELKLVKYLDDYLPKDQMWAKGKKLQDYKGWLIFVQPFLNGSRPDVVIFNPFVGIVIYEVKDWNLRNYSWRANSESDPRELFVSDSHGHYPVKNPIDQVKHYQTKITNQLVPIIGEEIDKDNKKFGLIKTGLYFHKAPTEHCRNMFGNKIKNFKHFPLFGFDFLKIERLKDIVPDVEYDVSHFWDRKWNDEIMFWLHPPYHSIEQGIPLKLKYSQIKVAEPKSGHHRVRGVAGSGKTQALAFRAGKLASMGKDVLIITFNITLWHYIRDMISRAPFNFEWERITFNHFHGFCKDKLNEFGEKWPHSPEAGNNEESETLREDFFKQTVPDAVVRVLHRATYQKYDAVLIDEGQDYQYEWYRMLSHYFLTQNDELLVVADKKQNIYDREMDWIDKRVTKQGLEKFKDPYIDLTVSFRMPSRVAEMSNQFSEEFGLNQELKVAKSEGSPVLFHSQHIIWQNIDEEKWLEYIDFAFQRLKRESYNPSDMVILLPNHIFGYKCIEHFRSKKIEINHVFEKGSEHKTHVNKKAFWMGDSRLKISTIHSFKGWELLNIVLFIPAHHRESQKKLDAIVYTAITRTRENLIVINSNSRYNKFGEQFPHKWNEQ